MDRLKKNFKLLFVILITVFALTATACKNSVKVGDTYYLVQFETNGGDEIEKQSVKEGSKVIVPDEPEKEGFFFDGWYSDEALETEFDFDAPVTANITLYAKWNIKTYKVTFKTDGGTPVPDDQNIEYNKTASKPTSAPVKENCLFGGWYTSADNGVTLAAAFDFATKITSNITLYAKWIIDGYIVDFETNGGENIESQAVDSGDKVIRPDDPVKQGYFFDYWYSNPATSSVAFDFDTPITKQTTLYAKWVPAYTVTFDSRYGSSVPAQTVKAGSKVAVPTAPTREGRNFDGWYTSDDGGVTLSDTAFDFTSAITSNVILYAKWSSVGVSNFVSVIVLEGDIEVTQTEYSNYTRFETKDGSYADWYLDGVNVYSGYTIYDFYKDNVPGIYILECRRRYDINGNYYSWTAKITVE